MTLSNWLELALLCIILVTGFSLLRYCRHKYKKMNGFEGIVTERGAAPRRIDPNLEEELRRLKELVEDHDRGH